MNEGLRNFRASCGHAGAPLQATGQNAQKHAVGQLDGSAGYPASARFLDLPQYACPTPWHDVSAALEVRHNDISRAT
jgi:hypothetical protein